MVRSQLILSFAWFALFWSTSARSDVFPCGSVQPASPTPADVTQLHPGHVSVIMAMGDSITAAFAENGKIEENRGDSWSGGRGTDDHWTLQYMIKHYNSSVTGGAKETTVPQLPETGYVEPQTDFLNVGISNAKSDYLGEELEQLQKQSSRIPNFEARWKVLTILIGANDLCLSFDACKGNADAEKVADTFEANVDATLAKIGDTFTNIYVNLVSLFRVSSPARLRRGNIHHRDYCAAVHNVIAECKCTDHNRLNPFDEAPEQQLDSFDATAAMLNKRIRSLAAKYNLLRPDFAVVAQVTGEGQDIPGMDFLSTFDCFHPSPVGQRALAVTLWNSMFDRQRTPKLLNETSARPFCPTPQSTFFVASKATENIAVLV